MKLLFNATNLKLGGGLQKATEFVRSAAKWGENHEWRLLLSKEVADNLGPLEETEHLRFHVYDTSPARPLGGRATRRDALAVERRFDPDAVFTLLGPAYIPFRAPHLMGYAVPWVTVPAKMLPWSSYPGWRKWRMKLWMQWQKYHARRADRWLSETEVDAEGFARTMGVSRDRLSVIPNSCASHYLDLAPEAKQADPHPLLASLPNEAIVLLTLAAGHPHKNHKILPEVAAELIRLAPDREWILVVTLDDDSFAPLQERAATLGVEENLLNLGRVPVEQGPSLYSRAQVMLLPTLLEVFSASYPEAMAMEVPIVTSDLPFARDVCADAALFAAPDDAGAFASQIVEVVSDAELHRDLVKKGRKRLRDFGTAEQRFERHLELFEQLAASRS